MNYIQTPKRFKGKGQSLFLAGGITNCPEWQKEMTAKLSDLPISIMNPRQEAFDFDNPQAEKDQIIWEFEHLRKADAILFWFPKETLCPITLYELGAWSRSDKPLFIGVHPEYKRIRDIQIQTSLVRPDITIYSTMDELAETIRIWATDSLQIDAMGL